MTGFLDSLSGQTALITGAGRRIGQAIAIALAQAGADIVLHYHTSCIAAEQTREAIETLGRRVWLIQGDLADPAEADGVFDRAIDAAGSIRILINNASSFPNDTATETSYAALTSSVALHGWAPLVLSRRIAALHRPGVVINLLDTRVLDYDREHASYHLGKRMLYSLTRLMAVEFAPTVRVNGVAPGLILPPENEGDAYLEKLRHTNPLNETGELATITETVLFLVRNTFITGQIVYVDGGRHLRGSLYA